MKFTDMLQHCWDVNQSLLCVGLDPDPKRFPKQRCSGTFRLSRSLEEQIKDERQTDKAGHSDDELIREVRSHCTADNRVHHRAQLLSQTFSEAV